MGRVPAGGKGIRGRVGYYESLWHWKARGKGHLGDDIPEPLVGLILELQLLCPETARDDRASVKIGGKTVYRGKGKGDYRRDRQPESPSRADDAEVAVGIDIDRHAQKEDENKKSQHKGESDSPVSLLLGVNVGHFVWGASKTWIFFPRSRKGGG